MMCVKNKTVHKLKKKQKKQPVYHMKTKIYDTRRKEEIDRGEFIRNFTIRTSLGKLWCMLYNCRPTMDPFRIFWFQNIVHI